MVGLTIGGGHNEATSWWGCVPYVTLYLMELLTQHVEFYFKAIERMREL